MSGILQKLKRKSLFEQLQERFPIDLVPPFGKVMVIPSKAFKNEWKEKLEAEGIESFSSSYGVQACFFLRKKKHTQTIEESPAQKLDKPAKEKLRAKVKELYEQGLSGKEIAEKLGCKIQVVGGLVRHLPKLKEKHEETKSNTNDPDIVKELLSACSLLYPSHRESCLVLLKEIRVRMAVGSNK